VWRVHANRSSARARGDIQLGMFLFAPERELRHLDRVRADLRARGRVHELRSHGFVAVWLADRFTTGAYTRTLRIGAARPSIDRTPVCRFEWRPATGEVSVQRRWSGEFAAYYWDDPFIVASHLRLAALAFGTLPPSAVRLRPSETLDANVSSSGSARWSVRGTPPFRAPFTLTRQRTVARARSLLAQSVIRLPPASALLLSGGLDSSAIAATAAAMAIPMRAFVFSLRRPVKPQTLAESDLQSARVAATHVGMPLTEILLNRRSLAANVPLAVQLAETPRGTHIDEAAALVSVARVLRQRSIRTVLIGESADDLFGTFTFVLRLYRGPQLRRYLQRQLERGLPDDLAHLQNIFRPWGISVVDPYWTRPFVQLGYNLPLEFRLDRHREMKAILRDAFASMLPPEILRRPKCVTRDATQVRDALAARFGAGRERYRAVFKSVIGSPSRL
jgi:asparagine synthetase B (glutamine-hydrolysing)